MEGRDFEMGDEAELLKVPCLKKKITKQQKRFSGKESDGK